MSQTGDATVLKIDGLVLEPGEGRIGLTCCPGRRLGIGGSAAAGRGLETDVEAIAGWGATAVLTLLEEPEMRWLGAAGLGAALERRGIEWHHLPIPDGGVPDGGFETRWAYSGRRLRRQLARGGSVLVHCHAGLGRAGLVAARLLVELGEDPGRAIRRVREARPGAVEYWKQEAHVLACVRSSSPDPDGAARVLGCLLGGALGDAFGHAVEGDSLDRIRARFGATGLLEPVLGPEGLMVSDDTQLTLFTAEGLVRGWAAPAGADGLVESIRLAYLDWAATQDEKLRSDWTPAGRLFHEPYLRVRRGPGPTSLSALREAAGRGTPERPINASRSCGGVMRAAPIGLIPVDADRVFALAARAAALTHGHPDAYLSAGAMAAMVRLLLEGRDLVGAASAAVAQLERWPGGDRTAGALGRALDLAGQGDADPAGAIATLGHGWVGDEALAIGVYAALAGPGFAEVIRIGANHDGDSDTTASIAGQLSGAWRGIGDLPHRWVRQLDVLDPLLGLAAGLIALAEGATSNPSSGPGSSRPPDREPRLS